jgi:propanol-preferring alcohol dehydrogenase
MRAMVLTETGPAEKTALTPKRLTDPTPGRGEVLIAIEACGVCRTDLHLLEGEVSAKLPVVPGHQVVGRVRRLGAGVSGPTLGQTVGVGWLFETCGHCRHCRSDQENLCQKARNTGRHVNGGYAEKMVARADYVFPLPARLPARDAAPLLCAGVIGYRSLKISGIRPGEKLGLVGFGASAHLAIQVARHWGCEIYVFTRERDHRKMALEMGAAWAGEIGAKPRARLDAAVTFAPAGEVIPPILDVLAPGGAIAVNAIHMSPIPSLDYDRLYWEKGLRSVTNYTRQDVREFLSLAARIPIRAKRRVFPLAQATEVLRLIKRGKVRGAAVLEIAR